MTQTLGYRDPQFVVGEVFLGNIPDQRAAMVPSDYQDSGGSNWGDDLKVLGDEVFKRYVAVVDMLKKVKP